MKNTGLIFLLVISSLTLYGQDVTGKWNGVLKVQGIQLRLVFNVTKSENGYSSTMDSPDQGAKGIPTTTTSFENSILKITVAHAKIEYEGSLGQDSIITGTFKQAGQSFPMNLSKKVIEKEKLVRPQEPIKPYPYYSEDIIFENKKEGIRLAGTLTLPNKNGVFPVAILITGSGPQNRNQEIFGHKPFLVISDYLTKHGIAVLRYDDRGVGDSKGNFKTSNTADFSTDVESAITYLQSRKEINKNKIGLIGHSEGGIIAPMVASKSKDVAFLVLLAGTGIQGDKLLLQQQELIANANGVSDADVNKLIITNTRLFDIVVRSNDTATLKENLTSTLKEMLKNDTITDIPNGISEEEFVTLQVNQITSPWMLYFLKYNPVIALEKVKCPVLAINGEKDLQVSAKENLSAIKNALLKGGNKKVTVKEYLNLNHLFQECETGLPEEYAIIEQTIYPPVLIDITNWILKETN